MPNRAQPCCAPTFSIVWCSRDCSRLPDANDRHEAAGAGAFAAVTEEEVRVAGRAEAAGENVLRAQASGNELRAVGSGEIEMHIAGRGLVARGHHVEPLQGIGLFACSRLIKVFGRIRELRGEFSDELRAHFIAARSDGGAERGQKIGGLASKFEPHAANSFFGDPGKCTLPARMNGSYSAFLGIDNDDWDAIGRLHGKEQTGAIGGGGVAFARVCRRGGKQVDGVGMNLLERREGKFLSAKRGLQKAAVFVNVLACIPFHDAEIEDGLAIKDADAAGARAESVNEPLEFAEWRELKDLQATGTADGPRWRKTERARRIAFAV